MIGDWPLGDLTPRKYKAAALDFPWYMQMGAKGRPQHYKRMRDPEIAAFPIADLAHPDGCNFLVWIPSALDGPRFWENIWPGWKAQGLRYSGRAFVWIKTRKRDALGGGLFIYRDSLHMGMGLTTRKNAEDVLLFKIGKPKRLSAKVHEVIFSPVRRHSEKPELFYDRVQEYCAGPYCDVFSRQTREGWDSFGDERGIFDEGIAA